MKKRYLLPFLLANLLALEWSGFAQGTFLFRNISRSVGLDAPVFDSNGTPLFGTDYLAELWGAATTNALLPAVVLDEGLRREFAPFTFVEPGYFSSPENFLAIRDIQPSGWAWLQVRAWDARLGATYEEVAALGIGGFGESPLFYAQSGNPFDQFPFPGRLIGLESFSLRPIIPEPSTLALFALGSVIMWMVRQRRHACNRGSQS